MIKICAAIVLFLAASVQAGDAKKTNGAEDAALVLKQKKEVLALVKNSVKDNVSFAKARKKIVAIGDGAEPALISRLAAKDPKERANVVFFLAAIGSRKSIPYFLAKKNDPNHNVRISALEALQSFKDAELIDRIAKAYLGDSHPSVRDMAVIVLAGFGDKRALKHLAEALDDSDEFARTCARKGFEKFSGEKAEGKTEQEQNAFWKKWYSDWVEEQKKEEEGKRVTRPKEDAKGVPKR